jgi:hypothetical protein
MKKIVPGGIAGLLAAAVLAAPTVASAAKVTVRVEGDARTLVPRTLVTTTDAPVGKPGQPTCAGTSALGALDRATAGDWAGPYDAGFQTYSLETLKGETHSAASSSYWAFWIDYTYASLGLCGQQVQDSDDLLFVPECFAAGCAQASPLRLTVPARVAPRAAATVKVEELTAPVYPSTTTISAPAAGATVTSGSTTVTTGADGTAVLTFTGSRTQTVQATKPGHVRSAVESTCVTTGQDGFCGSRDTIAPTVTLAGLRNGKVFKHGRGPRKLAGSVTPDPSGLSAVRLSIVRKVGKRCWAYDGGRERFARHRCGGWKYFRIGDRNDWSYLLPKRLPHGRYTIKVAATDKSANRSESQVVIRVR